jgi:hypothetical protein
MDILAEFEKRFKHGEARFAQDICRDIAIENGLDPEEVIDFVYIHRFENDLMDEVEDCTIEGED